MTDKEKLILAIGFIKGAKDNELMNAKDGDDYEEIDESYSNILNLLKN